MRALLIRPPYSRLKKTGQAPYFPLGIGYIAATLEKAGITAAIYHAENPRLPEERIIEDEEAVFYQRSASQKRYFEALDNDSHPIWEEVRQTIRDFKPDIVGISVLTVEVGSALKISEICKKYNPSLPVVWGGVHPTFNPGDAFVNGTVDFVVRGEGEETFLELCRKIEKGEKDFSGTHGVSFVKEGKIVHNPPRALIEDVDTIPFPASNLILYPESFDYKSMGSMIASRGCPWRCAFCSSRLFWEKKLRLRSPENIIEEIKAIKQKYGVNYIMFWDDSFSVSKKVAIRYCKQIVESGLNITWRTATRADLVDDELLYWMKRAGCVKLEIGVETGSPRMQKLIKKDVDNELVRRACSMIKKSGIAVGAFFMAGFPEETLDDMEQTFALMKDLNLEEVAFNIVDPMPGSDLLTSAVSLGLVDAGADWSRFRFWPDRHFMAHVPPEAFNQKAKEMGAWVYKHNNDFSTKFRKLKSRVWFYIRHDPKTLAIKTAQYIGRRMRVRKLKTGGY
ncbi:MAG: B12-binding domain-containing radical SAM protein [Nitrospinae bacterium]|nr:B12-binding domain-containing radical SAM protein [Nitrospinota bacterium]